MRRAYGIAVAMLVLCGACGGAEDAEDAAVQEGPSAPAIMGVRGARYCEILTGYQEGAGVRIDVYNTYGLNDCPAAAWDAMDPAALQEELQADTVILNGPRHWVIDGFVNSALLDTTTVELGGIEMRKAGQLDLTLAEAMQSSTPYVERSIQRTTTYVFEAGKVVHELVDPAARVFVMQSYSLEQAALSEAELGGLGERLALPAGWSYRTRELAEELRVTAVGGVATVVQDELENTYQLSQQ